MNKTRQAVEMIILSDDDFEIKSKIYSLNCLSQLYFSYFELQDVFIPRIFSF